MVRRSVRSSTMESKSLRNYSSVSNWNLRFFKAFCKLHWYEFRKRWLMRDSCHIRHLMKCPNWCRTWSICFLLIFSWKMLQPNFAFWDIFMLLRCLNSKEIKLQSSIRVICIIFDLIFFQLKIKNITNIPSSTTISMLRQASNMTWKAHKFLIIGGKHWRLQTPWWNPLQKWRRNEGDDGT